MPTRAPYVCGCGFKIASGSACPCQQRRNAERKARADHARPTARERGYDSKWQREREAFLRDRPRCERIVGGRPCGAPATVVHHVLPHRGDRRLFWSRSNWSPRCRPCHDIAEQAAERRGGTRGAGRDFRGSPGTGAGSTAQHFLELSKTRVDGAGGKHS